MYYVCSCLVRTLLLMLGSLFRLQDASIGGGPMVRLWLPMENENDENVF
jgi:hypothetical protein